MNKELAYSQLRKQNNLKGCYYFTNQMEIRTNQPQIKLYINISTDYRYIGIMKWRYGQWSITEI